MRATTMRVSDKMPSVASTLESIVRFFVYIHQDYPAGTNVNVVCNIQYTMKKKILFSRQ